MLDRDDRELFDQLVSLVHAGVAVKYGTSSASSIEADQKRMRVSGCVHAGDLESTWVRYEVNRARLWVAGPKPLAEEFLRDYAAAVELESISGSG